MTKILASIGFVIWSRRILSRHAFTLLIVANGNIYTGAAVIEITISIDAKQTIEIGHSDVANIVTQENHRKNHRVIKITENRK